MSKLKDRIVLTEETVLNTYDTDSVDTSTEGFYDGQAYADAIRIDIINMKNMELEFDFVNADPPIANAIRRCLIAEVPTVAIEKVIIHMNTSLIQDEVLAHRLGLIPLRVDPRGFKLRTQEDLKPNPDDSVVLKLCIKCTRRKDVDKDANTPEQLYENVNVYSKHLLWEPVGDQAKKFELCPVRCVDDDILLAKLRPGQEIELTCLCVKGIGRDHAKFSPVATASYRLLPEIKLLKSVQNEAAKKLQGCFSEGVISLEEDSDGNVNAQVKDSRRDMCSRNVFKYPDLAESVLLARNRRHFIFSVESTGAMRSEELVIEALDILHNKCRTLLAELTKL